MIILEGPDSVGKTSLAKRLEAVGLKYYHFGRESKYIDYIEPLCKLEMTNAVLDRHAISEYPYSICMQREFGFNIKMWHNLLTMTLIQNPVIVLCTHKPLEIKYDPQQYLPYKLWDSCMALYVEFLATHHIPYMEYNYLTAPVNIVDILVRMQKSFNDSMAWWRAQWTAGYGCAGSSSPQFLLVAERIGPSNMHNIPFEAGPTGSMLSYMLAATGTPIGSLAITNMVKSHRNDTREVNARDLELLQEEITHLQPKKVIFMGTPSKKGIPLARSLGCEVGTMVHLGFYNHKGITDMSGYYTEWQKMIGLVPTLSYKEYR